MIRVPLTATLSMFGDCRSFFILTESTPSYMPVFSFGELEDDPEQALMLDAL
jgi:hypothetical protein